MSGIIINPYMGAPPANSGYTVDYVIYREGSIIKYASYDITTGVLTPIASFTQPETTYCVATDGQFIFLGNTAGFIRQYSWNGSSFTQVLDALFTSGANTAADLYIDPANPGRIVGTKCLSFGRGIQYTEFKPGTPYSFVEKDNYGVSGTSWNGIMDFRFNGETEGYGSVFVPIASGQSLIPFESDGSTLTQHGSVTQYGGTTSVGGFGWDRDTGLIVHAVRSTSLNISKIDPVTKNASLIGAATSTVANANVVDWSNGYLIVLESDAVVRSYSLSGLSLTLIDSAPPYSTSPWFVQSPYTDSVYSSYLQPRHYKCDGNGFLTVRSTGPLFDKTAVPVIAFHNAPLTIT